jgi:general secretion pathway protein M
MNTSVLGALRDAFSAFWEERNVRERNMLLMAAVAILLALVYLFLLEPALNGRERLQKTLPELRQQAAEMQVLARQMAAAGANRSAPAAPVTKEIVDRALERRGLTAQNALVSGELVRLQFNSASFAAITGWLEEMQRTYRLSVTEASVEATPVVDMVNATLSLRQQRNGN